MNKQAGFTLIELAIVLVIIGLLLGGVLRGQELINSARVKNLSRDFQNTQVYLYTYQDRFRAIPGDDNAAGNHVNGGSLATNGTRGNGRIEGEWDTAIPLSESLLFWQHVRLASLAPGNAALGATNTNGAPLGIQSLGAGFTEITTLVNGAFAICSGGILGRDVLQIDTTLDDGLPDTGSVQANRAAGVADTLAIVNANPAAQYTVCMAI
jgi:prepilin-type N-terminal cleavage/methylation domain-containing protein